MSGSISSFKSVADLPAILPIFPLPGALLLPNGDLPLNIFEPRYLQMVAKALSSNRLIGMIQPRDIESELDLLGQSNSGELYTVGCVGRITSFVEADQGQVQIILTGVCRFRMMEEIHDGAPFRSVQASYDEFAVDMTDEDATVGQDRELLLNSIERFLDARSISADWDEVREASTSTLVNMLTMIGSFSSGEKQALLEASDLHERTRTLMALTEMAVASTNETTKRILQ